MPPDDARPCRESNTSTTTLPSVGMPRRVGLNAKSAQFGPKIFRKYFATAKVSVRDRLRSRQNPCRPTMPGLAASQTRPQRHCKVSASTACRSVWNCMRNRRGPDRKIFEKRVSSLSAGDFQAFIDFRWLCIVHKAKVGCCSFSSASKVVKSNENACKK